MHEVEPAALGQQQHLRIFHRDIIRQAEPRQIERNFRELLLGGRRRNVDGLADQRFERLRQPLLQRDAGRHGVCEPLQPELRVCKHRVAREGDGEPGAFQLIGAFVRGQQFAAGRRVDVDLPVEEKRDPLILGRLHPVRFRRDRYADVLEPALLDADDVEGVVRIGAHPEGHADLRNLGPWLWGRRRVGRRSGISRRSREKRAGHERKKRGWSDETPS